MNRVVALKVLSPQLIKTEKARELFQREVIAVGRLVHPNIVTAYDANVTGDRPYLVMEYVAGPDLERLVAHQGPLRPHVASEIMRQAALGLQYAFEMGMLHRDIKPANILIQSGQGTGGPWVVKLVDFGLARLQEGGDQPLAGLGTIMTKENTVMGTPDYLSPEQSRDLHKVDIRSDLYSLGCTFYYLLTGQVPFPGGTALDKMIRHATEEPTPLEKLRPDIPADVAQVVRRLMAKKPEDRFQTPGDLARALSPLASGASSSNLNLQGGSEKRLKPGTPGESKKGQKKEVSAATPDQVAAAKAETLPPSLSPTPLPEPKPLAPAPKAADESAAPYGLFIALGMVVLTVLVAMVVSFFFRAP
jgi:serine/threonine-protein kinase